MIIVAFVLGYFVRGGGDSQPTAAVHEHDTGHEEQKSQVWTCSMHPQIRQPKPGQCPLCGMNLIPVQSGGAEDEGGVREIKLSPSAKKLAGIQVAPVERKFVTVEIRMVGKVDYDETRLGRISAWVSGRIDRLYVDYTGVSVKKGDHMVYLYSPELLTAQEELIQALKAVEELRESGLASIKETALLTVDATRVKLSLWGLTQNQIKAIELRGKPSDHMTVHSPMSGIVIHKHAVEGMYVKTGTKIYTIADLSQVWVKLDAYESDLAWIRYGQEVEFRTEAYPGDVFKGKITFIDPVLDAKTRTVKVRVNVPNLNGRLKPEMFVRALVRADMAADGLVLDTVLAGKWICPMHPEVVKDEAGLCDLCGMPLAQAESLGYVSTSLSEPEAPLVIPVTAPLLTGKRAVVYVASPDKEGSYSGREIELGPRAGDYYLVKDGLIEGELVVVNGNFKIDSAVQILAKPSMMSPEGGDQEPEHHHGAGSGTKAEEEPAVFDVPDSFKNQLDHVLEAYFKVQQALSNDTLDAARSGAGEILSALKHVDMGLLEGQAHMRWMKELERLNKIAKSISTPAAIEEARQSFSTLSELIISVVKVFGAGGRHSIIRFNCSMAFDGRGADWLQNKEGTRNPYYGVAMLMCGEQVEIIHAGD